MSVELPKDAEGREIPLDTVALFNRVGNDDNYGSWSIPISFCPFCGRKLEKMDE